MLHTQGVAAASAKEGIPDSSSVLCATVLTLVTELLLGLDLGVEVASAVWTMEVHKAISLEKISSTRALG